MTNTKKIKAAMVLNGYTFRSLSQEMEMSLSSLFKKVSNKAEFTSSEIVALSEKLGIKDKDEYFFVRDVN